MEIENFVLWRNRSGENTTWFHPKCCCLADGSLMMTVQSVGGSDFFGNVCESLYVGQNWLNPRPIPGLDIREIGNGISEGICDVVPYFHQTSNTVLAIGHSVYYRNEAFFSVYNDANNTLKNPVAIRPYWAVRNADGEWVKTREKLLIPELEECVLYTCGCTQWFFRGNNEVIIPFYYGFKGRFDTLVCSAKFFYNGEKLEFIEKGNSFENTCNNGLAEPSIIEFKNSVLMTIRAEDGRGYVARSADGVWWEDCKPWQFDDGELLSMSSTQQHFLSCGGKLFLVYTRQTEYNRDIFWFRAPLFIAEINDKLEIIRESEKIVFPVTREPEGCAGMGNFHITNISHNQAIITAGEERAFDHFRGDTLLAHITF